MLCTISAASMDPLAADHGPAAAKSGGFRSFMGKMLPQRILCCDDALQSLWIIALVPIFRR